MRTGELIDVLGRAGLPAEAMEVAEALWLAATVGPLVPPVGSPVPRPPRPVAHGPARDPVPVPAPGDEPVLDRDRYADEEPTADLSSHPAADPAVEAVPLTLPAAGEAEAVEVSGRAFPVSKAPALPDRAALLRALRPLKRRIDSRRDEVLDEDATAQRIADGGPPSPVLRPARERWLDAVVVVDSAPSMDLWTDTAGELRSVLRQLGAFRDIRLWRMGPDGRGGLGVTPYSTQSRLDPGVRSGSELIDFSGRRLFLVFTDATSEAWRDGSAAALLAGWTARGYVVIVQPLPERLWSRTGLNVRNGTFLSFRPGTFTSEQTFVERRRRPRELAAGQRPVPVVELRPAWLAAWSRTVSGATDGGIEMAAAIVSAEPSTDTVPPPAPLPGNPATLIGRFFAGASPDARRLAVCLAAVPLDLQVVHLVQRAVVPSTGPTHVAEVLLSGLLRRLDTGPVLHRFDFRPGVRALLLDELRISDMRQVLDAVSEYVSAHGGLSDTTFGAIAATGAGAETTVVAQPFAWIPPELVERLAPPAPQPPPRAAEADDVAFPAYVVSGMLVNDRYRLGKRIEAGRAGDVWRATDQLENRAVVVKIFAAPLHSYVVDRTGFHDRFLAVRQIRHRSVAKVYDCGFLEPGGIPFVVMESVPGSDLSEILRRAGEPMTRVQILTVIAQAAAALDAMHAEGVVHGDVDLAAIRFLPPDRTVLTGFRFFDAFTRSGGGAMIGLGTSAYVAPEARLSPEPASDVYALGVVAYRCLAGRLPTTDDEAEEISLQHRDRPSPPESVDVPSLVLAALARNPADRPTARELAAAAWEEAKNLTPPAASAARLMGEHPIGPQMRIDPEPRPAAEAAWSRTLQPNAPVRGAPPYTAGSGPPVASLPDSVYLEAVAGAERTLDTEYPPVRRWFARRSLTAATILSELLAAVERWAAGNPERSVVVANRFVVSLSPDDHAHFGRMLPPMGGALAAHLERLFRLRGWYPSRGITVELVASRQVRSREVSATAEFG